MTQLTSSRVADAAGIAYHPDPLIVRGSANVLKLKNLLIELCIKCGQETGWDDLEYFFSLTYARNKTPWLILILKKPGLSADDLEVDHVVAAVLVHEYRIWGWRTRIFTTDDYVARKTMIAPGPLRLEIARVASRALFSQGAAISLISFQEDAASAERRTANLTASASEEGPGRAFYWTTQQREIYHYLPLETDFEKTMGNFGKRTRSHMRYYRRRAERELGCYFVPEISISKGDFLAFNRVCSYPPTDEVCAIRYTGLKRSPHSFLSGIRDKDGNWLSMVGGLKKNGMIEIYWQMNYDSLPDYSLSTVMRSFLIEYEISCGTRKLFIEGGTPHPMRFSFVREVVTDLVMKRTSTYVWLISQMARHVGPGKSYLAQVLEKNDLHWQS